MCRVPLTLTKFHAESGIVLELQHMPHRMGVLDGMVVLTGVKHVSETGIVDGFDLNAVICGQTWFHFQ